MATGVMIVEDEAVVALDMTHELESAGYSVVCHVTSGEEAVAKALELKPDVILMDITIQGHIDGISAAQQIADKSRIPFVFVTAHADEATLQRAKLTRPYGYILKPFEPNEIGRAHV